MKYNGIIVMILQFGLLMHLLNCKAYSSSYNNYSSYSQQSYTSTTYKTYYDYNYNSYGYSIIGPQGGWWWVILTAIVGVLLSITLFFWIIARCLKVTWCTVFVCLFCCKCKTYKEYDAKLEQMYLNDSINRRKKLATAVIAEECIDSENSPAKMASNRKTLSKEEFQQQIAYVSTTGERQTERKLIEQSNHQQDNLDFSQAASQFTKKRSSRRNSKHSKASSRKNSNNSNRSINQQQSEEIHQNQKGKQRKSDKNINNGGDNNGNNNNLCQNENQDIINNND